MMTIGRQTSQDRRVWGGGVERENETREDDGSKSVPKLNKQLETKSANDRPMGLYLVRRYR